MHIASVQQGCGKRFAEVEVQQHRVTGDHRALRQRAAGDHRQQGVQGKTMAPAGHRPAGRIAERVGGDLQQVVAVLRHDFRLVQVEAQAVRAQHRESGSALAVDRQVVGADAGQQQGRLKVQINVVGVLGDPAHVVQAGGQHAHGQAGVGSAATDPQHEVTGAAFRAELHAVGTGLRGGVDKAATGRAGGQNIAAGVQQGQHRREGVHRRG